MRFIFKLVLVALFVYALFTYTTIGEDLSSIMTNSNQLNEHQQLEKIDVQITRIVDGDTVNVILPNGKEESIRLLLIDTPESVHVEKEPERYGQESSDFVKELLHAGDKVTLEKGNPERDKYDRLLGYIWLDNVNMNQLLIEKGFARVAYVYPPNTKYLDEFQKAEQQARENELKIWSIPGYVTDNGFDMSVVN